MCLHFYPYLNTFEHTVPHQIENIRTDRGAHVYLQGSVGQLIYMKSLMLRSSRAFLGGGGFLGLWAMPGDICRHTFVSVINEKKSVCTKEKPQ